MLQVNGRNETEESLLSRPRATKKSYRKNTIHEQVEGGLGSTGLTIKGIMQSDQQQEDEDQRECGAPKAPDGHQESNILPASTTQSDNT
jgi:hypothetical protein